MTQIFPEYGLEPWQFDIPPKGFFEKREHRIRYIDWLRKTVGVYKNEELTTKHFLMNSGSSLLYLYGGSPQAVLDSLIDPLVSNENGNEAPVPSKVFERSRKPHGFWVLLVLIDFLVTC